MGEYTLSWSEDGRAAINYYVGGKRRFHRLPVTIKTQKDADKYAAAFIKTVLAQSAQAYAAASPTLEQIAIQWWAMRDGTKRLSPATKKQDKYTLTSHVLPVLGTKPITELTTPVLRQWLRDLCAKDTSGSTIRNVYRTFAMLCEDAIAEGWVPWESNPLRHPAVKRELPKASKGSRLGIRHLSPEQINALCTDKRVPVDRRVRYLLAVCTGLRDGEISGLSWGHIEGGLIRVDRALALAGENAGTEIRAPKTELSARIVPVHSVLGEVLALWHHFEGAPSKTAPVFASPGGRFYRPKSAVKIAKDLKTLGFDPTGLTFHSTRRTFATLLNNAGVSESTVGLLMGHAPNGVTVGHYSAATMKLMADAIEQIKLGFEASEVLR